MVAAHAASVVISSQRRAWLAHQPRLDHHRRCARLGAAFVDSAINPITREFNYQSQARVPNTIPSLEELIQLAYSRKITTAQLAEYAGFYGAQLGPGPTVLTSAVPGIGEIRISEDRHALWKALYQNNRPHYPLDMLRKWTRQHVPGAYEELSRALTKDGFPTTVAQGWFLNDWEVLDVNTILDLYFLGQITVATYNEYMAILGYRDTEAQQILRVSEEQLDAGTSLQLMLQGLLGENAVRRNLMAAGVTNTVNQDLLLTTRFQAPGIAGIVAMAGRQTWDDDFASLWGLDSEKPDQYATWADRSGVNFSSGTDAYGTQDGVNKTWADQLWRGHWTLPSLGDLAQIVHRFRGDPNNPATWSQPGIPPLAQSQIYQVMGAMGIPPLLRGYIGNLFYSPIPIRYIRLLAASGQVDQQYVAGKFMDMGYSPADAQLMSVALFASLNKPTQSPLAALEKSTWLRLIRGIESAYGVGVLNASAATAELAAQGVPTALASSILAAVDLESNTATMKSIISRTKSDVFSGRITLLQAKARLIGVNMDPVRIAKLITAWTAEFSEGKKQLATSKILSLLRKGLLTQPQALVRLTNLGWTKPDEVLLLAEVQGQVAKDKAAAVKALEASVKGQERQIVSTLKSMSSTAGKLLGRLKVITSPADIVKWYKDGIWTERQARQRLLLLGYPDDIIDNMLLAALGLPAGSTIPESNGKGSG